MKTGEHITRGWIGVDLDGTLAEYHGWPADGGVGRPISAMVERVKRWLREGKDVRIFTARVSPPSHGVTEDEIQEQYELISDWCVCHVGVLLPITCVKDRGMILLFDDRCARVEANTGRILSVTYEGEI